MIKTNDRWFRILVILVPCLVSAITNRLIQHSPNSVQVMKAMVSFACIITVCEGNRFLIYQVREKAIAAAGKFNYNVVVIAAGLLFTSSVLWLSTLTRQFISTGRWNPGTRLDSQVYINNKQITVGIWGYAFINALIIFFFLFIVYEVLYHYAKLQYTEKRKEVLEKEKLKAELHQLKGIVNPHFLFNNLNSLSSLIAENPVQAEQFLDELTKVFRYLLRNNETELTTLANELHFIRSYYNLLQTRYGSSIQLNLDVEKEYEALLIPPLTLQLLVENAVKHNRLQKEFPLLIELYSSPGKKLVVKNNICRKEVLVESTGIGLQNINARYRMLNREGVVIEKTEEDFSVIIPLIH